MTLDEFFKECKRKGMTPVRYKEITEGLNGRRIVEYVNPMYANYVRPRDRDVLARVLERGRFNNKGDGGVDNLVSNLYGEEVVIRTRDGFHHGKLLNYDGESFMLGNYLFNNGPMEMMDYETEFFYGGDTLIPAKDIISISKISDMAGDLA